MEGGGMEKELFLIVIKDVYVKKKRQQSIRSSVRFLIFFMVFIIDFRMIKLNPNEGGCDGSQLILSICKLVNLLFAKAFFFLLFSSALDIIFLLLIRAVRERYYSQVTQCNPPLSSPPRCYYARASNYTHSVYISQTHRNNDTDNNNLPRVSSQGHAGESQRAVLLLFLLFHRTENRQGS